MREGGKDEWMREGSVDEGRPDGGGVAVQRRLLAPLTH